MGHVQHLSQCSMNEIGCYDASSYTFHPHDHEVPHVHILHTHPPGRQPHPPCCDTPLFQAPRKNEKFHSEPGTAANFVTSAANFCTLNLATIAAPPTAGESYLTRPCKKKMDLHEAAMCGDVEKARYLLQHGKYDVTNRFGFTPLLLACWDGHLDMVRMLISEFKADPQVQLYDAVREGNSDVVLMLITEFGCDANARNSYGKTVLHVACEEGNFTLARTLIINHNADINARNENNDIPLHLAAERGNNDIALMLITEFGCDANARNTNGETVLHMACKGGSLTLVRTLIVNYNADVNASS